MQTFRLPMPPSTNHGYRIATRYTAQGPRAMMMKTDELVAWELTARAIVGDYVPRRLPLEVHVTFGFPKRDMRRNDLDGRIKFVLDAVVGRRRDQYVDMLVVEKVQTDGEGYAEVSVGALESLLADRVDEVGDRGCFVFLVRAGIVD